MSLVIQCRDISKSYISNQETILGFSNCSFLVEAGSRLTLLCESKLVRLSIINILIGLDAPTSGEYLFEGTSLSEFVGDELIRLQNLTIGRIHLGHRHMVPSITLEENIGLPLQFLSNQRDSSSEQIGHALRTYGLEKQRLYLPEHLTEVQYIAGLFAGQYCKKPALLLIDEGDSPLSNKNKERMYEMMNPFLQDNCAVVFVVNSKFHNSMDTPNMLIQTPYAV